jgi:DNA-binding NarL/FixJ family response regulator
MRPVIDEIPELAPSGAKTGDFPNARAGLRCEDPHVQRTVLIVDDHAPFRRLARRLLEAGGFTVVGEAADGGSALASALELRPELVLLDVLLPDMDGFTVAQQLAAQTERPVVVLTSSRDAVELGERLERAAAAGFIHKDELSAKRLAAVVGAYS